MLVARVKDYFDKGVVLCYFAIKVYFANYDL